jgi:hypothetical protein
MADANNTEKTTPCYRLGLVEPLFDLSAAMPRFRRLTEAELETLAHCLRTVEATLREFRRRGAALRRDRISPSRGLASRLPRRPRRGHHRLHLNQGVLRQKRRRSAMAGTGLAGHPARRINL